MEEEKEELESTVEMMDEKLRKLTASNDQLQNELAVERSTSQKHDNARTNLERQVRNNSRYSGGEWRLP